MPIAKALITKFVVERKRGGRPLTSNFLFCGSLRLRKEERKQRMEHLKFQDLDLSPEICKAVLDMGFEEATPIQSMAISVVKEGRDVIGQSQTGTGKTAAFGIPCLERVNPDDRRLQALILCPTRELAIQVSEEFRKLLKYKENIRVLPIYGGQPIDRQIAALKKGAHVVIGTPGRVMDHMRRRTLKMETVQMMVLDEADEMLDMGFREDIEMILTKIPEDHQTLLFSATLSPEILDITRRFLKDPEFIKVVRKELTVPNIEQAYFDVKEKTKLDALTRIIDVYDPRLAMVFCNTKKRVDDVVELLQGRGYFAEGLHGDLKQPQRDKVMQKFRNGTIEILVATDVAARGIDVDDIDVVFNYDVPQDEEYYVHRIGRTGRAGKSGKAFTFCVGKEIYKLRDIMRYTKTKIAQQKLPTLSDVEEMKTNIFLDKLKDTMNEGHLTKYINLVDRLMQEDFTAIDIAAALLKNHLSNVNVDELDVLDDINLGGTEVYGGDDEKMVRLFINAGKKNKIRTKDIVGAIANETGVPGKVLGAIDLYDDYAFVDIPKEYVKDVLVGMKNAKIKNKRIHMEIAKKDKSKKNN
jgi:ATP-dependent RNA helicase DeaD